MPVKRNMSAAHLAFSVQMLVKFDKYFMCRCTFASVERRSEWEQMVLPLTFTSGAPPIIFSTTVCVCCTHKLTIACRSAVSLGHQTVSFSKLQA